MSPFAVDGVLDFFGEFGGVEGGYWWGHGLIDILNWE